MKLLLECVTLNNNRKPEQYPQPVQIAEAKVIISKPLVICLIGNIEMQGSGRQLIFWDVGELNSIPWHEKPEVGLVG